MGILILSLSILLLVTTNVSASELEKSEVSDLFTSFIDLAYENPRNITAIDSSESDVTKEFINVTSDYYQSQDYKAIQNYINDNNLEISITKTKDLNVIQKDYSINSDIRSRNVSKKFYASGKAANGRKKGNSPFCGIILFMNYKFFIKKWTRERAVRCQKN